MIERGPIPAVHGVVRWRIIDLVQWLWEEFAVAVSKLTLSRELRALGYRKLSARPRHQAQDTETMNLHLIEISQAVAPGAHAVLLMDQAGWHTTPKLDVPENITIISLPAKAPELNPVENVWQFIRDNWLSNRVFASYREIVDHCCDAWNRLVDQPWRIMSIGRRHWAQEF